MYFTAATTVTIQTDDGMEVYIDGQAVFAGNAWKTQSTTAYTNTIQVQPGTHQVMVKWYQWEGEHEYPNRMQHYTATNTC
jgi:hypothetical protein